MRVIDPGRDYELSAGNGLAFLRRDGDLLVRNGTTNEEVLEVLIHRLTEGYQAVPCGETIRALHLLTETLAILRSRTAHRVSANVEGTQRAVETSPTLPGAARDPRSHPGIGESMTQGAVN